MSFPTTNLYDGQVHYENNMFYTYNGGTWEISDSIDLMPHHHYPNTENRGTNYYIGDTGTSLVRYLTPYNGALWTTSQKRYGNSSLSLDGSNDFYALGVNFPVSGTNTPFSVCFWFRSGNTDTGESIISHGTSVGGSDYFNVYLASSTQLTLISVTGGNTITSTATLNNGSWHHVCIRFDKSYIEFILDNTYKIRDTKSFTFTSATGLFNIGRRIDNTLFYTGNVNDLRLFNRCITDEELFMIYSNNISNRDTMFSVSPLLTLRNPIHHYKLHTYNSTYHSDDGIGNGNNLYTVTGTLTLDQTGIIHKSIYFSGNAYLRTISTPTAGDFPYGTPNCSICFWMKPTDLTNRMGVICLYDVSGTSHLKIDITSNFLYVDNTSGTYQFYASFPTLFTTNTWYHISISFKENGIYIYIDGDYKEVVSQATASIPNTHFYIAYSPSYNHFIGNIEDVRIYDYILSEWEIKKLYNEGNGIIL